MSTGRYRPHISHPCPGVNCPTLSTRFILKSPCNIDWDQNQLIDQAINLNFNCLYQGFETLQEMVDKWEGPDLSSHRFNLKLFADKETYEAMDDLARLQDKTAHQLAMEVIRNFVSSQQNGKSE